MSHLLAPFRLACCVRLREGHTNRLPGVWGAKGCACDGAKHAFAMLVNILFGISFRPEALVAAAQGASFRVSHPRTYVMPSGVSLSAVSSGKWCMMIGSACAACALCPFTQPTVQACRDDAGCGSPRHSL